MRYVKPRPPIRLTPQGTRVVILKSTTPRQAGVVSEVRREPHLKSYVIACDDGTTVYASAHDLALEDDGSRTPLAPAPEY